MEPEDRVTGPGQSEGTQQGRTGWEKRCVRDLGKEKTDLGQEAGHIGERDKMDDLGLIWRKGWDRPAEGKRQEQGGASPGEEAVRNTVQMGEMVPRRELERG